MKDAISPNNIIRHELIGLHVKVVKSNDPGKEGLQGSVFDETKKTLKIDTGQRECTVPKKESEFMFELPRGQEVRVNGKVLVGRSEERIKKKFPGKWKPLD